MVLAVGGNPAVDGAEASPFVLPLACFPTEGFGGFFLDHRVQLGDGKDGNRASRPVEEQGPLAGVNGEGLQGDRVTNLWNNDVCAPQGGRLPGRVHKTSGL